ncbi:MAG: hypothetical protein ACRDU8_04280, partial [Egibacteraceae bacterium]
MEDPAAPRRQGRVASAVTLVLLMAVLVVAARSEPPVTSARTGRRVELVELIRAEQGRVAQLEQQVTDLSAQIAAYQEDASADKGSMQRLQGRIDRFLAPAGMTPVRGPGVAATLSDSSLETS